MVTTTRPTVTNDVIQIAVTLPDGRDVVFPTHRWRRDGTLLLIESEEDPPEDYSREVLGMYTSWWGFRLLKRPG